MAKNNAAAAQAANNDAPLADPASVEQQTPPDALSTPPTGNDPPPESEFRKILLLVDCAAGKCAQVVDLLVHEAESLVKSGHADDHPAAIAAHEG